MMLEQGSWTILGMFTLVPSWWLEGCRPPSDQSSYVFQALGEMEASSEVFSSEPAATYMWSGLIAGCLLTDLMCHPTPPLSVRQIGIQPVSQKKLMPNLQQCNPGILVQLHHLFRQVHKQVTIKKLHTVLHWCNKAKVSPRSVDWTLSGCCLQSCAMMLSGLTSAWTFYMNPDSEGL